MNLELWKLRAAEARETISPFPSILCIKEVDIMNLAFRRLRAAETYKTISPFPSIFYIKEATISGDKIVNSNLLKP